MAQPRSCVGKRVAEKHSKGECSARKGKYLPVETLMIREESDDTESRHWKCDRLRESLPLGQCSGRIVTANRPRDRLFVSLSTAAVVVRLQSFVGK